MYAGAADKIYVHSCCVKISVSSDQQNFPFSVVDEKQRDVSLRAGARQIRPEFRRTLLKRQLTSKKQGWV